MSVNELLQAGIAAVRAGDQVRARRYFTQLVKLAPNSEYGWLGLGQSCSEPEQQAYCFRRALAINPSNAIAWRELGRLSQASQAEVARRKKLAFAFAVNLIGVGLVIAGIGVVMANVYFRGRASSRPAAVAAATCTPASAPSASSTPAPHLQNYHQHLTQTASAVSAGRLDQTLSPGFVKGACPFSVPAGVQVDCGYIAVPEDRQRDSPRLIRLAVAIFRSTGMNPASEPAIYLEGGPGSGVVKNSVNLYAKIGYQIVKDRDFIVFDQRGMGLSIPELGCQELATAFVLDLTDPFPDDQREQVYIDAVLACRDRLTSQGIDLSAYTSKASAADVKDIINILGYQQAHLYGVSYGTLLAQVVIRDHPQIVRSVVLDSVVPIEARFFNDSARNSQYALDTFFAGCAADPACQQAYPNLRSDFIELVDRLNAQPIIITITLPIGGKVTRVVDGTELANAVLNMLNVSHLIPVIPQSIYRIQAGDYTSLNYALSLPMYLFANLSLGAYISINCHDEVFTTNSDELGMVIQEGPAAMAMEVAQMAGSVENLFNICTLWGAAPLLPGENEAVFSDVPALVLSGRYDPTTPPIYGRQVAQHLSRSFFYEVPDQGHGPSVTGRSNCLGNLVRTFFHNPEQSPDQTCLDMISPVQFLVSYTGDPPVQTRLYANADMRVRAEIPARWRDLGKGFFTRNISALDITKVGIQSSATTIDAWLNWLETEFQSKRGFDRSPVLSSERVANGQTWYLYQTSLDGHPVDMAFTDNGNRTLMVLLYSFRDEHDALYRDVFLRAIDTASSTR